MRIAMARLFDKIPTVMKMIEKNTENRFSVWQVAFERSPAAGDTGCLELFIDIVVETKKKKKKLATQVISLSAQCRLAVRTSVA